MKSEVNKRVYNLESEIINFAQQLIRTPSVTEHEGDLAKLVQSKMVELGYDHVWVDELGNVVGAIGNGPTRMLIRMGPL